ncbi:OmpA family protein [Bacteroides faecichinchillae]|uniref:OmpA family protein n=2 Tax=Bacteroides TaxID=816 RepID=A0A1M5DPR3_9BACE|nr:MULTISPECIES: OmpA family protein [Bacteroides]THG64003.1 OmpA family protein [Bacteroides faecichinchillae]GCB34622.1 membrane protein [Bacteroides faecalis]GCB34699.1 membrane protein [Bacteroides faecalis]SHF68987.1 OmpA family protein [Bacteroides faecichinchillae]
MKSKLVILSLLLAGAAVTANAQTKEKFTSERFKDNIFISVGGGAQVCVNPDNSDYGLGKAITPLIHVSLGKWVNPTWGFRGQVAGLWSTLNSKHLNGVETVVGNQTTWYKIKNKKYFTLRADALYNLSNSICGYNPDRLFTLSVFAGPGLTFAKTYGDQDKLNALINGSVGLMGQFNINDYWDINIEARGEVSPSIFGKYSNAYTDGAVSLTAGVTYTFGGKKFISCNGVDQDAINDEVNRYRSQLEKAKADLDAAKRALANVKPEVREVVKTVQVPGPRAVFFKIGKATIDDYGLVNLKLAAKVMKENPNKKYKIAGYADKATGSVALNKKLADKRAQAVYDALVKEGVNKDQLEVIGYGGTDNMFGKNFLNRVVILE